ncbi:MAG: glycosyltransferase family 61 protein [Alphaproteobacteria bacterium]
MIMWKILYIKLIVFIVFITCVYSSTQVISVKNSAFKKLGLRYIKIRSRAKLNFKIFPIASSNNATWADPIIPETFIIFAKNGYVYSKDGIFVIEGRLIKELIWPWSKLNKKPIVLKTIPKPNKLNGKIAVIAQEGHVNYYHWVTEIIPKILLFEKNDIHYDLLYVPELQKPFMEETFRLLGIDTKKIIQAKQDTCIEADELILPSFVSRSCYTPKWVADSIRGKLIPAAYKSAENSKILYSKKIFISRRKAAYRNVLNEDDVFEKLKGFGVVRYDLENLSMAEQIVLFNKADVIIAPHGAGLTNILFCKPDTVIIELFQEHEDDTYWYLSQILGLKHYYIKTTSFEKDGGYQGTSIPMYYVEKVIAIMNNKI